MSGPSFARESSPTRPDPEAESAPVLENVGHTGAEEELSFALNEDALSNILAGQKMPSCSGGTEKRLEKSIINRYIQILQKIQMNFTVGQGSPPNLAENVDEIPVGSGEDEGVGSVEGEDLHSQQALDTNVDLLMQEGDRLEQADDESGSDGSQDDHLLRSDGEESDEYDDDLGDTEFLNMNHPFFPDSSDPLTRQKQLLSDAMMHRESKCTQKIAQTIVGYYLESLTDFVAQERIHKAECGCFMINQRCYLIHRWLTDSQFCDSEHGRKLDEYASPFIDCKGEALQIGCPWHTCPAPTLAEQLSYLNWDNKLCEVTPGRLEELYPKDPKQRSDLEIFYEYLKSLTYLRRKTLKDFVNDLELKMQLIIPSFLSCKRGTAKSISQASAKGKNKSLVVLRLQQKLQQKKEEALQAKPKETENEQQLREKEERERLKKIKNYDRKKAKKAEKKAAQAAEQSAESCPPLSKCALEAPEETVLVESSSHQDVKQNEESASDIEDEDVIRYTARTSVGVVESRIKPALPKTFALQRLTPVSRPATFAPHVPSVQVSSFAPSMHLNAPRVKSFVQSTGKITAPITKPQAAVYAPINIEIDEPAPPAPAPSFVRTVQKTPRTRNVETFVSIVDQLDPRVCYSAKTVVEWHANETVRDLLERVWCQQHDKHSLRCKFQFRQAVSANGVMQDSDAQSESPDPILISFICPVVSLKKEQRDQQNKNELDQAKQFVRQTIREDLSQWVDSCPSNSVPLATLEGQCTYADLYRRVIEISSSAVHVFGKILSSSLVNCRPSFYAQQQTTMDTKQILNCFQRQVERIKDVQARQALSTFTELLTQARNKQSHRMIETISIQEQRSGALKQVQALKLLISFFMQYSRDKDARAKESSGAFEALDQLRPQVDSVEALIADLDSFRSRMSQINKMGSTELRDYLVRSLAQVERDIESDSMLKAWATRILAVDKRTALPEPSWAADPERMFELPCSQQEQKMLAQHNPIHELIETVLKGHNAAEPATVASPQEAGSSTDESVPEEMTDAPPAGSAVQESKGPLTVARPAARRTRQSAPTPAAATAQMPRTPERKVQTPAPKKLPEIEDPVTAVIVDKFRETYVVAVEGIGFLTVNKDCFESNVFVMAPCFDNRQTLMDWRPMSGFLTIKDGRAKMRVQDMGEVFWMQDVSFKGINRDELTYRMYANETKRGDSRQLGEAPIDVRACQVSSRIKTHQRKCPFQEGTMVRAAFVNLEDCGWFLHHRCIYTGDFVLQPNRMHWNVRLDQQNFKMKPFDFTSQRDLNFSDELLDSKIKQGKYAFYSVSGNKRWNINYSSLIEYDRQEVFAELMDE